MPGGPHLVIDHARLRGAQADGRALLADALDAVTPAALGLPPKATLFVRRLKVASRLTRDGMHDRFAAALRDELRARAVTARRGYGGGGDADLLFEDEAALEAAIVTDVIDRPGPSRARWWTPVVAPHTPRARWRRHLLPDPVLLAPTIDRLAGSGHAAPWLAGFDDVELDAAIARMRDVFAPVAIMAPALEGHEPAAPPDAPAPADNPAPALIAALAALRPDAMPTASPSVRTLILTAGVAVHRPAALSIPGVAVALGRWRDDHLPATTAPRRARSTPAGVRPPARRAPQRTALPLLPPPTPAAVHGPPMPDAAAPHPARATPTTLAPSPAAPRALADIPPPSHAPGVGHRAAGVDADVIPCAPPAAVATHYGGLFFLLNAMVALGLFGNLAEPRGTLRGVSPFELLDLLGARWFGTGYRTDPIGPLLRRLSGLDARARSGRDFDPPAWHVPPDWMRPWPGARMTRTRHPAGFRTAIAPWPATAPARRRVWIAALADYLDARLAAALGCGDARAATCAVPARIAWSDIAVDVYMALDTHPIALRLAGLDRDPGFLPAAGRRIGFVFA